VRAEDEPRDPVSVSPRPLKREVAIDIEPVSVLISEVCLPSAEVVPSELVRISSRPVATNVVRIRDPVRLLARPFVSELAKVSEAATILARPLVSIPVREIEPVKVLDRESCLRRPEDVVIDPVRLLNNAVCSDRLELRVNEPARIRKNDDCLTTVETRPREPATVLAKLLVSAPDREIEPVRVLNSETCSAGPVAKPSEALKALLTPLA
jgi:hypothetical protein